MKHRAATRPSVSTRTAEFTPRELPLTEGSEQPEPLPPAKSNATSSKIRDALRRWFDQEM